MRNLHQLLQLNLILKDSLLIFLFAGFLLRRIEK